MSRVVAGHVLLIAVTLAACVETEGTDASSAEGGLTASAPVWAKSRQNARNTGASGLGAASPTRLWRYQATGGGPGNNVDSDPVIDADGNVYVGGREGATSLTPSGAVRWRFATPAGSVVHGVQLTADGGVLVSASSGGLYKLDQATGTFAWGVTTGTTGAAAPLAVAADGTILVGSQRTSELLALSSAGALKWRARLAGAPSGLPAIRSDGLIYVPTGLPGSSTIGVQLVDPRRARTVWTWTAPAGTAAFTGGVVVRPDDTALVAGYTHSPVIALDPRRANPVVWTHRSSDPDVDYWAAPVLGFDGTIYVAEGDVLGQGADKRVVALSPSGAVQWSTQVPGNVNVAPALGRNGLLYVLTMKELPAADADLRLLALDARTGAIAWSERLPTGGVWPSVHVAPALGHGRVYVGVNEGYLDGPALAGSLHAFGAATLLADAGEPDPVPVDRSRAGSVVRDTTLYSPQLGFVAWLSRGTAVRADQPPLDVAARAGFTWAWVGTREGWIRTTDLQLAR